MYKVLKSSLRGVLCSRGYSEYIEYTIRQIILKRYLRVNLKDTAEYIVEETMLKDTSEYIVEKTMRKRSFRTSMQAFAGSESVRTPSCRKPKESPF
jgi:hypothetical protein